MRRVKSFPCASLIALSFSQPDLGREGKTGAVKGQEKCGQLCGCTRGDEGQGISRRYPDGAQKSPWAVDASVVSRGQKGARELSPFQEKNDKAVEQFHTSQFRFRLALAKYTSPVLEPIAGEECQNSMDISACNEDSVAILLCCCHQKLSQLPEKITIAVEMTSLFFFGEMLIPIPSLSSGAQIIVMAKRMQKDKTFLLSDHNFGSSELKLLVCAAQGHGAFRSLVVLVLLE